MNTRIGLYTPSGEAMLIEDARSGLDCKCICLDCGTPLIAVVNTTKKARHFQHHNPSRNITCLPSSSSNETMLHLMLKKAISDRKRITAPPIYIKKKSPYKNYRLKPYKAYKGGELIFDTVIEEKRIGRIIPDCIGKIGDRSLLIEVKVTHGVDDLKRTTIENQNNPCVELYANASKSKIPEDIISDPKNYEWIHETRSMDPIVIAKAEVWFDHQIRGIEKDIAAKRDLEAVLDTQERDTRIRKLYGKKLRSRELMPNERAIRNDLLEMIDMGDRNYVIDTDSFYNRFNSALLEEVKAMENERSGIASKKNQSASELMLLWAKVHSSLHYYADFYGDTYPDSPDLNDSHAVSSISKLIEYASGLSLQVEGKIKGKHFESWANINGKYGQSNDSLKKAFVNTPMHFSAVKEYKSTMKCFPYANGVSFPSNEEIELVILSSEKYKAHISRSQNTVQHITLKINELTAQLEKDTLEVINEFGREFDLPEERATILSRYCRTPNHIRKELNRHLFEYGVDTLMTEEIKSYKKYKSNLWQKLNELSNQDLRKALNIKTR